MEEGKGEVRKERAEEKERKDLGMEKREWKDKRHLKILK